MVIDCTIRISDNTMTKRILQVIIVYKKKNFNHSMSVYVFAKFLVSKKINDYIEI